MAPGIATTSRDDLLNSSLFVWVFKSGIWLSIPETCAADEVHESASLREEAFKSETQRERGVRQPENPGES